MVVSGGVGRRPGRPDTREQILVAARRRFASVGYDRATVRAIADEAGVDARLVHHYFGSKQRLFVEAVEIPVDPESTILPLIAAQSDPAAALAGFIAGMLEDPEYQRVSTGLIRAAAADPDAAALARDFLTLRIVGPVAEQLEADEADVRVSLLASQIAGLVLVRNILGLEPLASLGKARLTAALEPVVRRYLLEPLP